MSTNSLPVRGSVEALPADVVLRAIAAHAKKPVLYVSKDAGHLRGRWVELLEVGLGEAFLETITRGSFYVTMPSEGEIRAVLDAIREHNTTVKSGSKVYAQGCAIDGRILA